MPRIRRVVCAAVLAIAVGVIGLAASIAAAQGRGGRTGGPPSQLQQVLYDFFLGGR